MKVFFQLQFTKIQQYNDQMKYYYDKNQQLFIVHHYKKTEACVFKHAKLLISMKKHSCSDTQYYACVLKLKTLKHGFCLPHKKREPQRISFDCIVILILIFF